MREEEQNWVGWGVVASILQGGSVLCFLGAPELPSSPSFYSLKVKYFY